MATWTKICAKQVQSHAKRSQGFNQKYACTNNYKFHNKRCIGRKYTLVKTSQLLEELVDKCNDKKKTMRKNID